MSTRSSIGIYDERKGTVSSIYCMNDGYLEGVGAALAKFYTSERDIRQLLSGKDISSIAPQPELCTPMLDPEPQRTVDEIASLDEAFDECSVGDEEYLYLYVISETGSPCWYYIKYSFRSGYTKPRKLPQNPSPFKFSSLEDARGWLTNALRRNDGHIDRISLFIDYRNRGVSDKNIEEVELSRNGKITLVTDRGEEIAMDSLKPFIQYGFIERLNAYKGFKLEALKRAYRYKRLRSY